MEENRVLLIIPRSVGENERDIYYREMEIRSLIDTLGLRIAYEKSFTLKESHTFGPGQINEICQISAAWNITEIIVDDFLSPREEMRIEKAVSIPVSDREALILSIFKVNAHSKEAKLQTRKAELVYLKPRLVFREANFSQQRGGVRGAKGEGETERELKRRTLEKEITGIEKELSNIEKRRKEQYRRREKSRVYSFALTGYTNSGKTTLLNSLSSNSKEGEDKLFATLDTTTRAITLPSKREVLISDTVGFIINLPPSLIKAFSSTLNEALYCDSIIIVADSSHPNAVKCFNTTIETLKSLSLIEKVALVIINKIDEASDDIALSYLRSSGYRTVETSFKTGEGIESLFTALEEISSASYVTMDLLLDLSSHLFSSLTKDAIIRKTKYTEDGKILVKAEIPIEKAGKYSK